MGSMRKLFSTSLALLAFVVACVGDDATPASGTGADAGSSSGNPPGTPPPVTPPPAPPPNDGGGDANLDSGPWTPAQLDAKGNLALWLDARNTDFTIATGLVDEWRDRSSHAHKATSTGGPTVDAAVIAGHDALHFTSQGTIFDIKDSTSLQFGGDQVYMTAVAKVVASANGQSYFFSKVTVVNPGTGNLYDKGIEFFATHDVSGASFPGAHVDSQANNEAVWNAPVFDDAKFHIVSVRRTNAAELVLTVDDLSPQKASTGSFDVSMPGSDVLIGGIKYGNINRAIDFELCELVVVHGTSGIVADTDVTELHAYLKAKYGL
jgi:hypothetical protein